MKKLTLLVIALLLVAALSLPAVAEYPPGIMFASLLNNVRLVSNNASFSLDNQMQGVFMPAGAKGWVIFRKADGAELYRFDFKTELIKLPYMRFDFMTATDLSSGQSSLLMFPFKEPGSYVLDFYLEGAKFYTFLFSIAKKSPSDPFAGGDVYLIDGDWSSWAYLYYPKADPGNSLSFKVWLRHDSADKLTVDYAPRIEITRDKDKKLVCTSRENQTISLHREWNRFEFDMIFPMVKTSGGAYFKAKDLLAVDGSYTLKLALSGKLYGTWKFSVKGGKLTYGDRTDRSKADPLTFIEGGQDAWWYKKM